MYTKLFSRLCASAAMLLLVAGATYLGKPALGLLAMAVWLLGMREYWRMVQGRHGLHQRFYAAYGVFLVLACLSGIYVALYGTINDMLWPILIALTTDSGAYFCGLMWGKRKLCPQISPNKTWEGAAGGLLCAVIFDALYWHDWHIIHSVLATCASICVQLGDLAESHLKRLSGYKDSGRLLPGHGGVLDRIDGLLVVIIFQALLVATQWQSL